MPESRVDAGSSQGSTRAGRLTVVGCGIRAVAHFTQEAIGHIRTADAVFYSVPDGITAACIRELSPTAVNLSTHYGDGKPRGITYVQMAEVLLREVRAGKTVVAVFYGHPGYFVAPARRALAIARKEGYPAALLPGISSTDCLFADLRIDPSQGGCQILEATDFLLRNRPLMSSGHVVLLQVGSVGDATFSYGGFKHAKRGVLFERLIMVEQEWMEQDAMEQVVTTLAAEQDVVEQYMPCYEEDVVEQYMAYQAGQAVRGGGPARALPAVPCLRAPLIHSPHSPIRVTYEALNGVTHQRCRVPGRAPGDRHCR